LTTNFNTLIDPQHNSPCPPHSSLVGDATKAPSVPAAADCSFDHHSCRACVDYRQHLQQPTAIVTAFKESRMLRSILKPIALLGPFAAHADTTLTTVKRRQALHAMGDWPLGVCSQRHTCAPDHSSSHRMVWHPAFASPHHSHSSTHYTAY
jgi:hypothetical protein